MLGRLPAQDLPKYAHFYFKKYFPPTIFSFPAISIACTVDSIAFALPRVDARNGTSTTLRDFLSQNQGKNSLYYID